VPDEKIHVALQIEMQPFCAVRPAGSVDLYKSRYTMIAKTRTRVRAPVSRSRNSSNRFRVTSTSLLVGMPVPLRLSSL